MTTYLNKQKISQIERGTRGLIKNTNWFGHALAVAIITAFCVSTFHFWGDLRGWGLMGITLGILSSIATEGAFIYHRYKSFPAHENTTQL